MNNVLLLSLVILAGVESVSAALPTTDKLMFRATGRGDLKALEQALVEKPDLEKTDKDGYTPFTQAIRYSNWAVARKLLEAGANPLAGNPAETVYDSLRGGQTDLAKIVMSTPGFKIDAATATRLLPIAFFFTSYRPEFAKQFLELGASPDLQDCSGLLTRCVDLPTLAQVTNQTSRALHDVARMAGLTDLAELFVAKTKGINQRQGDGLSRLLRAVRAGELTAVEQCLTAKAWLEVPDTQYQRTPLLWAATAGQTAIAERLLEVGANPEAHDKDGNDALALAIRGGHDSMVSMLLTRGSDPTIKASGYPSAMELAEDLHQEKIKTILETALTRAKKLTWTEDYEFATQQAKTTGKPLVLFFTGSDWCGYCMMLEKQVLSQFAFQCIVGDDLLLVKLDYPRGSKQAMEIKERNDKLKKQYGDAKGLLGFPTMVVITPDGIEINRKGGYSPSLKAKWLAWFRQLLASTAKMPANSGGNQ